MCVQGSTASKRLKNTGVLYYLMQAYDCMIVCVFMWCVVMAQFCRTSSNAAGI